MTRSQPVTIGMALDVAMQDKIARKLDMLAEIRHGHFAARVEDGCTHWTAPRTLGGDKYGRCRAYIEGIRDGMLT